MTYKYFPHTQEDIDAMLAACHLPSLDALSADVPDSIRFKGEYDIPEAKSEIEVRRFFEALAAKNTPLKCFAGAGVYDHYCPSVAQNIIDGFEFLTSYTPYQAEISQGTLHYIFEYQSMMTEMTGMDISNASMYDGTTATAEAMLLVYNAAKKADTVLVSETVDPKTLAVINTYAKYHGVNIETIPAAGGTTDFDAMRGRLAQGGVAGVIVQQPNFYGIIEDFTGVADAVHASRGLFVINSIAADLALLRTPGEWGADIAVGDGQSLGLPMAFGGPYVGYMCCTEKLMRNIRRQKATSNICSNESLMALYVTIYMALMGKEGIKEAATMSYGAAHYLHDKLIATGLFSDVYDKPFFNEFLVRYNGDADALQSRCAKAGFLAGVKTGDDTILFAATEKNSREDIDNMVKIIEEGHQYE